MLNMLLELVFQESPNSRLEIHPAENSDIITFLSLFLPVAYQVEETVSVQSHLGLITLTFKKLAF